MMIGDGEGRDLYRRNKMINAMIRKMMRDDGDGNPNVQLSLGHQISISGRKLRILRVVSCAK